MVLPVICQYEALAKDKSREIATANYFCEMTQTLTDKNASVVEGM